MHSWYFARSVKLTLRGQTCIAQSRSVSRANGSSGMASRLGGVCRGELGDALVHNAIGDFARHGEGAENLTHGLERWDESALHAMATAVAVLVAFAERE